MMLIFHLLSFALAQQYQTHPDNYAFTTRDAAAIACSDLGLLELCSAEQLYSVVFGTGAYAVPDLCKTGWTSSETGDYQIGWWNNDITSCAKRVGWNVWLPADGEYGAHCCSSDVPETSPVTCASLGECTGDQILVEGFDSVWCTDGVCSEEQCCQEWQPAPLAQVIPGRWDYTYASGDEADAACQEANEDWELCTYEQLEGLSAIGVTSCGAAWMKCNDDFVEECEGGYRRGFWVSEADAAAGTCGSNSGFRGWASADGMGGAHCCAPSYIKSAYGSLSEKSLEAAQAWCSTQPYTPNVCLAGQLETVALAEDPNICRTGYFLDNEEDTEGRTGWYQGNTECGAGTTGWRYFDHNRPAAHCCASYVLVPDLGEWTYTPSTYGTGYATGAAAEARCTQLGYDNLCTIGQVVEIGTNYQTDLCIVGWVHDNSGGYDAGYYRTQSGCGGAETWHNDWQPATPVAFCCMDSVAEMEIASPDLGAYYNGGWDYSYGSMEDAAAMCTGDYSLCSEDQVYTIAVHGVTYPDDGEYQIEPAICRLGWTSDDTMMWWNGDEATCGAAGYRAYSASLAGYHCCKDFPAQSPNPTTTTLGTYEAFTKAHPSYIFYSEEEAADACTALHPEFQLCSSSQIVEVALNGAENDGTFTEVAVQTELCFTSWVDSSRAVCDPAKDIGFYRVLAGCGAVQGFQWSDYRPTNPTRAGAFCCAPSIVPAQDYLVELDCAPETTYPPSKAPVETPTSDRPVVYFPISDSVCSELSVNDCSSIYTRDNEYYVSSDGGNTFEATCVAYSSIEEAQCDYTTSVCAGVLRRVYGSLSEQGVLLNQAMAEDNKMHASCPPSACSDYEGYSPEDFAAVVDYCLGDDGCYYMNGMQTCVCDSSSTDVDADLQNLWENTFEFSQCSDTRTFDEIMNDQLFITNQMITDLENEVNSIPDVNTQLQTAQDELNVIWTNWESEITATINSAIATAEADGNQEVVDSLNGVLDSLTELSQSSN